MYYYYYVILFICAETFPLTAYGKMLFYNYIEDDVILHNFTLVKYLIM
jgi:hypothetical protein